MLKDIANSDNSIHVRFDYYGGKDITLNSSNIAALKKFYNACEEAGIFEQDALYALQDDFSAITLLNK